MCEAREVMTPQPVKVPANTPIQDCARILWRLGLRHLPVVDTEGRCQGVITDFDLLQHGEMIGDDGTWMSRGPDQPRASDLARTTPCMARPSEPVRQVVHRMLDKRCDVVIVTDRRSHPIGILTEHDLVRWARLTLSDEALLPAGDAPIHSVQLYADAFDAFDAMVTHGVRHLIVFDEEHPVGVLSWRDLVVEDVLGFRRVRVRDLVRGDRMITLPVGARWGEIADLMVRHRIGCVPLITPDRRVAAVITRTDVLHAMLRTLQDIEDADRVDPVDT